MSDTHICICVSVFLGQLLWGWGELGTGKRETGVMTKDGGLLGCVLDHSLLSLCWRFSVGGTGACSREMLGP